MAHADDGVPLEASIRSIERAAGALATASVARMDETLPWFRELPADQGGALAVVAVTAFPHYFPAARTKGFAAYLVKPVDLAELCWTIASVLGRGTRAAPGR